MTDLLQRHTTAPASLVFLLLPDVLSDNMVMFVTAVAIGAEVNAAVIGWCARTLRRGHMRN
ncbi:SCO4225 family membrane protein [Streptomyces sp. NPDC001617]